MIPTQLVAVKHETADTVTLRIATRMVFTPGQFAMIELEIDGKPVRRSYSIASAPNGQYIELTVKRQEHGLFSRHAQTIQAGHPVTLHGPFGNHFLFDPTSHNPMQHVVFIAGGSGISPFRSMLQAAAAVGYRGKMSLIYSVRTGEDIIYRDELNSLAKKLDLAITFTLSRPTEEELQTWLGEVGRITPEMLRAKFGDSMHEKLFYVCGPTPMVQGVQLLLTQLGVPKEHVKTEKFGQIES